MPNRLVNESSPYLRQHAENPVDWYPWGEEAFARARDESKPIFLSVGYSTCHWCHVMAHESFEDARIAEVLNRDFVAIKVDREERPDVDRVYMLFVQATTGSGGWPMSVWLTPDLEPFYGGTYFPPASKWGRPGFIDILAEIGRLWRADPLKVRQSAANLTRQITQHASTRTSRGTGLNREDAARVLDLARDDFRGAFDAVNGGFGGAPKFPRPSELLFLLREFARLRDDRAPGAAVGGRGGAGGGAGALDMVVATLRAIVRGGIHDHLGGGFHRYAVDARWHVPHFEKMLYDQAQLVLALVEAFQVTGDSEFAQAAGEALDYVTRDLERAGGGFFSAEDADSVPHEKADEPRAHGVEGAFYVWTDEEFDAVLPGDAAVAKARFGVIPAGNVASDPHGEFEGKNVLYLAQSIDEIASESGRARDEIRAVLESSRQALFEARTTRPRPGRDDKLIVAWNGLMIGALARASRVLRHGAAAETRADGWLQSARAAASFIKATLWDAAGQRLMRRFREGAVGIDAYADDFACLVFGLIELFQADGDPAWLDWALALQRRQDELFWDSAGGGWYGTSGNDPSVLVRIKEDYDGAEPAASSVSAWNLLALSRLADAEMKDAAGRLEQMFAAFGQQLRGTPRAVPMMLAALSTWIAERQEIVIVGPSGGADTEALLAAVASRYLPSAVVVPLTAESTLAASKLMPSVAAMTTLEGRAAAYVCRGFACSRPTSSADELLKETGHGRVQ